MTDLKQAALEALEALETLAPTKGPSVYNSARDALRAALAEPQRELVPHTHEWFRTGAMAVGQCRCIHCGTWGSEVFTPQRQPLTDVDILQGWKSANKVMGVPTDQVVLTFARWLEAMHEIGGDK